MNHEQNPKEKTMCYVWHINCPLNRWGGIDLFFNDNIDEARSFGQISKSLEIVMFIIFIHWEEWSLDVSKVTRARIHSIEFVEEIKTLHW